MPARTSLPLLALATLTTALPLASAHVGVVNTQIPYAVAGKSYELVLTIPHGCAYTKADGSAAEADTYKVEVAIPAGFGGVRPITDAVFGRPQFERDAAGTVTKLTFTKASTYDATADDQVHRIAIRGTAPNAPFTTIRFDTKQWCKNPAGGADLLTDWSAYGSPASNQSPKVKIFPARSPGWNKFQLAATNEKHTLADVQALMTDFFADAQIVWLDTGSGSPRGIYSANPVTTLKIKALASRDPMTYELTARSTSMIHAADVLWVKY
jgi:hypothetical protein